MLDDPTDQSNLMEDIFHILHKNSNACIAQFFLLIINLYEDINMRKVQNFFFYLKKAKEMSFAYLITTLLRNLFTALLSLINIAGLGIVIETLVLKKSYGEVITMIVFYVLVNLAVNLSGQLFTLIENRAMRRASNVLQFQYMRDCLEIDYHYVQDGNVLNLKRNSMLAYPAFSLGTFGEFINAFIKLLGTITIFSLLSPVFIVVLSVLSFLLIKLTIYTQRTEYNFKIDCADNERKLQYLYDIMTKYKFAKEIRINNAENYISDKYRSVFNEHMEKYRYLLRKNLGANWLGVILSCLQSLLMFLYFAYQAASGVLSIAEYTVAISAIALFTSALLSIFKCIGSIGNVLKSVDILRDYEEILKNNSSIRETISLPDKDIDPQKATLRFENVSFRYPNADYDTIKNITFTVKSGEKLAIVGLNGAGKTTLVKLLLRLYKPTEGKITLDGLDIWEIPYKRYTQIISVVLQDFALFAYSIKENILFDKSYDPDRLNDSIKKSGLESKISKLPKGIETSVYRELDDNGIEFSGGDGQKLATARALYKNAAIFVLDEPTAALDPLAEYELFSRLVEITRGNTTLFITHRLSSTTFCDRILVLDEGSIIEQGSHEELIAKVDGTYAKLFRSQMKYYEEKKDAV